MPYKRKLKRLTLTLIAAYLVAMGVFLWFLGEESKSHVPLQIQEVQVLENSPPGQVSLRVRGQGLDGESRFNLLPDFANRRAIVGRITGLGSRLWDMAVQDRVLFLLSDRDGLLAYAIDRADPLLLGVLALPGRGMSLSLSGRIAYVGCAEAGILAVDVSDPGNMSVLSQTRGDFKVSQLAVSGGRLVASFDQTGLALFSLEQPNNPRLLTVYPLSHYVSSLLFCDNEVFLGTFGDGLHWLRVSRNDSLELVDKDKHAQNIRGLTIANGVLLAADRTKGVLTYPLKGQTGLNSPDLLPFAGNVGDLFFQDHILAVRGVYGGIGFFRYTPGSIPEELCTISFAPLFGKILLSGGRAFSLNRNGVEIIDPLFTSCSQKVLFLSENPSPRRMIMKDNTLFFPRGAKGLSYCSLQDKDEESFQQKHIAKVSSVEPALGSVTASSQEVSTAIPLPSQIRGFTHNGSIGFLEVRGVGNIKVDLSNPQKPNLDQNLIYPGSLLNVGKDRVVSCRGRTIFVFPLSSDPGLDRSELKMPFSIRGMSLTNDLLFAWDDNRHFEICSLADIGNPVRLGAARLEGVPLAVAAKDGWLWIANRGKGLQLIDARNPLEPRSDGIFSQFDQFRGLMFDPQGNLLGVSETGLSVLDVSHPSTPRLKQYLTLPGPGTDLAINENQLYVSDAKHALHVFDRQPDGTFRFQTTIFMDSRVYDLAFENGVGLLTDRNGQLMAFDFSNEGQPRKLSEVSFEKNCFDALPLRDRLIVAVDGGLQTWRKIGDDWSPTGATLLLDANPRTLTRHGSLILAALGTQGLAIVDAKNPDQLQLISQIALGGVVLRTMASGDLALLSMGMGGMQIVDIADPGQPRVRGKIQPEWPMPTDCSVRDIEIEGTVAYVAAGAGGLWVVDLGNPDAPVILKTITFGAFCMNFSRDGNALAVKIGGEEISILDITDPRNPVIDAVIGFPQVSKFLLMDKSLFIYLNWGALLKIPLPQKPLKKISINPDEMFMTFDWPHPSGPAILQAVDNEQNVSNNYLDFSAVLSPQVN